MSAKSAQFWAAAACILILGVSVPLAWGLLHGWRGRLALKPDWPTIEAINPPEAGFFAKKLSYHGILIKAPGVVADDALYLLYDRMARQTAHLPQVVANLAAAGVELHIIGQHQVTTDLPEWRQAKHVPLAEDNGLTLDQRTRGMGGRMTSCAEENILHLLQYRQRSSDICVHEFAHAIKDFGIPPAVEAMLDKQYEISKSKGLWTNAYAASNSDEYFAELSMWYFGTHGDRYFLRPRPEDGREGLKQYDPDAYRLFDDFYSGRIAIAGVPPPTGYDGWWPSHDDLLASAIVAKLTAYKVGETNLANFFADAGMARQTDPGVNGWYVKETYWSEILSGISPGSGGPCRFRVFFRNPANAGANDRALADLEFKNGVLMAFAWDN